MGGNLLEQVTSFNYLQIIFHQSRSWRTHIEFTLSQGTLMLIPDLDM